MKRYRFLGLSVLISGARHTSQTSKGWIRVKALGWLMHRSVYALGRFVQGQNCTRQSRVAGQLRSHQFGETEATFALFMTAPCTCRFACRS